jgi:alkylation response protein AidB-like acyl-CoA dehydrogenase
VDFSLTDEQQELKAEARRWLDSRYPADEWNAGDWTELAELGWLGVSVPEEAGGAGLGFVEEAMIFEELGRALYPGPYFATVGLALPALPADEQARVAAGERRWSAALGGLVVDPDKVDAVVDVDDTVDPVASIDSTRSLGRVGGGLTSAGVDVPRVLAALACEAVGIAQKALELGIEHASSRQQFGKPIGVYQAVSHQLSDTFVETELARSLAYWAAWSVAEGDEQAAVAAASAKAYCSEAAVAACERSIQVHGGTGFTWEHVLHRYYKRALWIEQFGGSPSAQRAQVAAALLG